jgi:hypothetical protein
VERVDDADDRAEQSDERSRRADRGERRYALLEIVRRQGGGALNRATNSIDEILAAQIAAGFLLELVFLHAGKNDLRQMAVAVVLRRGDGDGILEPAILQVLGDLRRVQLGLLARLRERVNTLDGHSEGNHRHDDENDRDHFRDPSHRCPHLHQIHSTHSPILRSCFEIRMIQ